MTKTGKPAATERLFSYGTLQLDAVQIETFGRELSGQADTLAGYRLEQLEIQSAAVVTTSGKAYHPVAVHTGLPENCIEGIVFAVTPSELAHADAYEVEDYRRETVILGSGLVEWAYVDARTRPVITRK